MQSPLLGALLGCPIARHARRIQAVLSRTQDRSNRLQLSYVFRKYTYTESTCFLSRIHSQRVFFLVYRRRVRRSWSKPPSLCGKSSWASTRASPWSHWTFLKVLPTVLMWCGTQAGSYLRLIDSCSTQLKAQGPFRTCNQSKEEQERNVPATQGTTHLPGTHGATSSSSVLLSSLELSDTKVYEP